MLTRLKVRGFKNLVDVDVRFGPFTCIAGPNGVGKSNLFDAIHFLSLLADQTLLDAAKEVRGAKTAGVRSLFTRTGRQFAEEVTFEAEMIVPGTGRDDHGQEAKATSTFLRYTLTLAYRSDPALGTLGGLEVRWEQLQHIPKGEAHKHVLFEHKVRSWRDSAVLSRRWTPSYISTAGDGESRVVRVHQDGAGGLPRSYAAATLPRTVLSRANAAESPTALLARREMQSWRILQLEPSALRRPDPFTAPGVMGSDGSHLASALFRLAHQPGNEDPAPVFTEDGDWIATEERQPEDVYATVANRLAELYEDVRRVSIERDVRRELLTVQVQTRDGTTFPSPSLSDGSLRFLALAVLEADPEARWVVCLEEPENGVHPERLPAMLRLLQDIATDVDVRLGVDNPLRQVIVNTHSPAVVQLVPEDSLLIAKALEIVGPRRLRSTGVAFRPLPKTWRDGTEGAPSPTSMGDLLAYLNPRTLGHLRMFERDGGRRRLVAEREDVQQLLPFARGTG
jgi:predicted ATPase